MGKFRRARSGRASVAFIEILEGRVLLSAAFDITQLTAMRNTPAFSQINGSGVGIAVLDTGVFAQNPDLQSNVVAFYNAVTQPITTTQTQPSNAVDPDGHGTHVSGTAASSNPSIGVAYGAKLVDIRVLANPGETQLGGDPVLRGLQWVAKNYQTYNIKVVNMSLGTPGVNENSVTAADMQQGETQEIHTLEGLGITVVTSSGNSYANDPVPGASYPAVVSTISVANTWADNGQPSDFGVPFGGDGDQYFAIEYAATPDTFAATSQRSTLPNQLAAPGSDIYSTWNGTTDSSNGTDLLHNTLSGTSMSAPFVSGVVALMQQAAYTFSGHYISDPSEILQILQQTADTIVDSNNPNNARYDSVTNTTSDLPETGLSYKRVNVLQAIEKVQQVVTNGNPNIGPAPGPDTDNTTTTATPVPGLDGTSTFTFSGSVGSDGQVIVGANDVDLFKLTVTSPGTLDVTLTPQAGGTTFASELRLFDSTGTQIASATGTSGTYPTLSSGTTPLTLGTYYVGVSGAGNGAYTINGTGAAGGSSQGDYTVTFALQNPDPNGVVQGATGVDLTQTNEVLNDPTTGAPYTDVIENGLLGSDPPPTGSTTRIQVTSDVDMYKITAPDTGVLNITTDTTAYSNPADTYLAVFDSNLNPIAANDNAGPGTTDSAISLNVTNGETIYVAVTVPQNAGLNPSDPYQGRTPNATPTDEAYDLHLRFSNGDTNGTAVTATQAFPGMPINDAIGQDNGVNLLGANGGNKDVDFFSYNAGSDGLIDVTATPTTPGFTPVVSLWEFTPGQTDITQVADSMLLTSPHLIKQVSAGENLFVSVTGLGNNNFNWFAVASGTGGQSGAYTLNTNLRPLSDNVVLNDNSIDSGTPTPITVGQTIKANLGMDGPLVVGPNDVDLYKLVAPTTETLDIHTVTSQEGSADTVLRVFDSSGNQLASNDNVNPTTTASDVQVRVQAGQTYYIGVSGAGGSALAYDPITGANAGPGSTGNYQLVVAAAQPGFSVSNPQPVPAYNGGTVDFMVDLTQPLTTTATVDYVTTDGTAVAGTDYAATSGTLTFPPGTTTQFVHVPILANNGSGGTRTFTLTLSNGQGAPVIASGASSLGTIEDIPVKTLTFSQGQDAHYTDAEGKPVTLVLHGPGTGTALFVNGIKDPSRITLNATTSSSQFMIRSPRALLSNVIVNGSLGAMIGRTTGLSGSLSVSGSLQKLDMGQVSGGSAGGAITIGAAGAPMQVNLREVTNETFSTPGAISSLSVQNWIDSIPGLAGVSALSIGALRSAGDFTVSLTSGSLGPVKVGGALGGGIWTISGSGNNLSAAQGADAGWSATFGGDLGVVRLRSEAGSLTARSIRSLNVARDMSSATIRLTGALGTSLGSLFIGGTATSSNIRSAGNVGAVVVGAFVKSDLFAGVNDAVTALPTSAADLTASDSIVSFSVTDRGTPFSFADSNVAAASIGSVSVANVGRDNSGVPFGIATKSLQIFNNRGVLHWTNKEPTVALVPDGDFLVRFLT